MNNPSTLRPSRKPDLERDIPDVQCLEVAWFRHDTYKHFLRSLAQVFVSFFLIFVATESRAQVYEKVFSFTDARAQLSDQGRFPSPGLVQGSDGNFYGMTHDGGSAGHGVLFRTTAAGTLTTLADLTDNGRGGFGGGSLIQGRDGTFYGTTAGVFGTSQYGTIFKITPAGSLTVLLQFPGHGGFESDSPNGVIQGSDGNFYGTTAYGGAYASGTIFRMTPTGVLTTLVEFTGNGATNKGAFPFAGLVQGSDGNFYGTTSQGGVNGDGTIFRMTPTGVLTTLVEFTGNGATNKGAFPYAGLVQGSDGNFYGTTRGFADFGTVFKMTPSGVLTTLVQFTGNGATNQGAYPVAALMQGTDGNFYGTTGGDMEDTLQSPVGVAARGTIFRMTPAGMLTTLVVFSGTSGMNRGSFPQSTLILGSDGSFYGTTLQGGINDLGTVFKVTSTGVLTTLVEFSGREIGSGPSKTLFQGSDGQLYGTTNFGGATDQGTVFKLAPTGDLTNIVEFTVDQGRHPVGGLVQGNDGNFYGTTQQSPGSQPIFGGEVFMLTPAGVFTPIAQFGIPAVPPLPFFPDAEMVQGNDGNFYGTTQAGGSFDPNLGTVFKVTPAGGLSILVEFTGNDGATKGSYPLAPLTKAGDGNFYGTTSAGGAGGLGTIFTVTPAGTLTTLVEFTGNGTVNKGSAPNGGLVQANDGNFYGMTSGGGVNDLGTVFKMTPAGVLATLVEFTGNGASNKGNTPLGGLVQASDGYLYGVTSGGGAFGYGTIFKITLDGTLTTIFEFPSAADSSPQGTLITGTDGDLYGTTPNVNGDGSIFRVVFPGAPAIYVLDPQPQIGGAALLRCKANARGSTTTVSIEFGTDGSTFPNSIPLTFSLAGYQTTLLGTTLTGLSQGTTYYYRIRAINSSGTVVSPVVSFTALAPPAASVTSASGINQTSASVNGIVNARSYDASVIFQYGIDGNTFPNQIAATPSTVTGSNDIAVSAAVAGLTKGTIYFYRVVATNAGGTTVSGVSSFTTLTEPTATIGSAVALSTISAQVSGSVNARGSLTAVSFEYGTDQINFPNSVSAIPSSITGNTDTAVTAALHSLDQGTTYYYRIRVTSAGGVGVSNTASFSLNILSGLTQVFPGAPSSAQGFVIVTLTPVGIQSGWRFVGEQLWRNSGTVAGGLTSGDRQIEFRPVPGYIQPLTETVTVTSGAPATQVMAEYFPTSGGQAGGLEVILKPDSIADAGLPVANRGQWRFLGEDDTAWRNSGVTVNGLLPGKYLVECKPIPGRNTPSANVVPVQSNQTTLATITYYSADATVGATPSVLPFQTVSTTQSLPYAYVGQIRSDVGSATGFVVNRRVVATAGHVVFDDGTLSYVTGLQWLFERDAGTYDPVPQIPQGFYVFDGYATQRTAEGTPGQSSVASQNLDVAALYFPADAGRGGYAGYLASDSTDNEFLVSSKLKMVVGYPVNGIPAEQQGRMFATSPFNVTFARVPGTDTSNNPYRVYTTQDITSAGGNSGGPICVLYDNGSYYPAAIYLGGSAQTSVRAIDSKVVDLFGRAEVSGEGGANQVGGGIIQVNTPISGAIFAAAALKVNLSPGTAVSAGAMWSLSPTDVPFSSGFERDNLNPVGTYTLYFTPATGFLTPPPAAITLTAGQLSTVTRTYFGVTTQPQSQIAPVGSNVTFSITTSGAPTGYQWRRNGINISGATASSYTLNNVTGNDTATYSCVVTWTEVAPSTVTGPVSQTSSAATLTVTDTFNSWSSRFFNPTELTNTQVSGPSADPEGDGVPNLLEFAFNLQPRISDRATMIAGTGTSGLPLILLETINNQKVLTIEFVRRRAAGSPGITYHPEFGSDLAIWSETGTSVVTQIDDTWERVKVTDSAVNQSKRFGRVRITTP